MQKRRFFSVVITLFLVGWGLVGRYWYSASRRQDEVSRPVKIGLTMATFQEERWQRDRNYFAERLTQLGGELITQTANNDYQAQLHQVEYLLNQGIDVLVIVPQDLNEAVPAVQMAKRAGVKVISYDRLIRNADLDLYISFDNIRVGELMAEYMVQKVPVGGYVLINGSPTDNNGYLVNQGCKNVLDNYIKSGRIRIVFEDWANDWLPPIAYRYIHSLLEGGAAFDAVIAANDGLASGVIEALSEWRLAGKIPVTGQDADLSACQRIVEGTQMMTVYKPIRKLAYRAAELAMELAAGKEIKTNHAPIFNGKIDIPSEIILPIPVDKSNMDLIIRDGFHRKEDIYLNISK